MPIPLTIDGNTYLYPVAGEDPNWGAEAEGWATNVTQILNTVIGSGDILEDNFPINNNIGVKVDISKLNFNPNIVRSSVISYAIYRTHELATTINDFTANVHADFLNNAGAKATGTITIFDYTLLTGATATVNGTVVTEGVEWFATVDNTTTAASLASAINAIALVGATSLTDVVTITADFKGTLANSYTLTTSDLVNAIPSGATLTGGVNNPAKYFTLTSANDVTSYYVWFYETADDSDPLVAGKTGLQVTILGGDTVAQILNKAALAINAVLILLQSQFTATVNAKILTIVCNIGGPITVVQSTTIASAVLSASSIVTYGVSESGNIQLTQLVPINNIVQWAFTQTAYGVSNVALSITTTGQIQYLSNNMLGANYIGKITFAAKVLNV